MKKAIFLCLSLCIAQYAESSVETQHVSCTKKNEKLLRHMLYKSYMRDNAFYKKKCSSSHLLEVKDSLCSYELFSNIDFFIIILEDHIKKLQKKLKQPKRFFQHSSFCKGLAFLSLGAISSYLTCLSFNDPFWPKKADYMEKITDFQEAVKLAEEQWMSSSVARGFLDEHFKSKFEDAIACSHYFNDFQRAQCLKNFKTFEQRFQYLEVYNFRKYCDHRKPYECRTVGLLGASILCFVGAYIELLELYKFCTTTTPRHKEYLKRDKKLLTILKAEKYNPSEDRSR